VFFVPGAVSAGRVPSRDWLGAGPGVRSDRQRAYQMRVTRSMLLFVGSHRFDDGQNGSRSLRELPAPGARGQNPRGAAPGRFPCSARSPRGSPRPGSVRPVQRPKLTGCTCTGPQVPSRFPGIELRGPAQDGTPGGFLASPRSIRGAARARPLWGKLLRSTVWVSPSGQNMCSNPRGGRYRCTRDQRPLPHCCGPRVGFGLREKRPQ